MDRSSQSSTLRGGDKPSLTKRLFSALSGNSPEAADSPTMLAKWMGLTPRKRGRASPASESPEMVLSTPPAMAKKPAQVTMVDIVDSDDDSVEIIEPCMNAYGFLDEKLVERSHDIPAHETHGPAVTSPETPLETTSGGTFPVVSSIDDEESNESQGIRPRTRGAQAVRDDRDILYTGRRNTLPCAVSDCRNCMIANSQYCYLHEQYGDMFDTNDKPDQIGADNDEKSKGSSKSYADSVLETKEQYVPQYNHLGHEIYKKTCLALTVAGTRCSFLPLKDGEFCSNHTNIKEKDTLKKFKGACKKYAGAPGTTQCRAITKRKTQCRMTSAVNGDLCLRHIRTPPHTCIPVVPAPPPNDEYSFAAAAELDLAVASNSDLSVSDDVQLSVAENDQLHYIGSPSDDRLSSTAESQRSSSGDFLPTLPSSPESYDEFDHSKDKLYGSSKREEQCIYVSGKGEPCPYRVIKDSIYCHGHFPVLELLTDANNGAVGQESTRQNDENSLSSQDSDEDDHDDDSDAANFSSDEEELDPNPRPYTHKEFLRMWSECEEIAGESTEEVENRRFIRSANQIMSPEDTDGQAKAQYGRLLPRAMKTLMTQIFQLKKEDVFLDIGHGIGNTCLQAAFTSGCEARGVEVVLTRDMIARVFRDIMMNLKDRCQHPRIVGKVDLRYGRMEETANREFLTKGVTRAYVNNFNGVFAERSVLIKQNYFLDDYVSGLFALMSPGAIMVTLHPLTLGPTRDEANALRLKHGLSQSNNASFYTVERVLLGKACDTVKWCQHSGNAKNIYVYKYTRLAQPSGEEAVFLCCIPECQHAKSEKIIPAIKYIENDRCVVNNCDCGFTAYSIRRQRKKNYNSF